MAKIHQHKKSDLVVLELRVPKDLETTPEAAASFFKALPFPKTNFLKRIFGNQVGLSFEILNWNQRIFFMACLPQSFESYFLSQITAQYPQSMIGKVDDYLPYFFEKNKREEGFTLGQLVLAKPFYFPLKTYLEFKEIDPLKTVLGTLAKAGKKDKILIQVIVGKAPKNWQDLVQKASTIIVPSHIPGEKKIESHPQKALFIQKASQVGFRVGIRILVVSENTREAESLLENLAGSFGSFSSGEGNQLVLKKPLFWQKKGFLASVLSRSLNYTPSLQVLNADELATLFHLPNEKLAGVKNIAWGGSLKGEPPENLPVATVSWEEKKEINFFAKTEFKNRLTNFGIKREDRRRHLYIIGKTGTGKSTLIANMAINDMRNREGLAVVDPHGDLSEILLDYVPKFRLNDVCYLDPSDTAHPFRLNPLEVINREQAELVASGIVSIFYKLYSYSWGPRLEYILRNSILTLVQRPNSVLEDVVKILTDDSFRQKVVEKLPDKVLKNFWLNEYNKMPAKLKSESISPILNKVGQFVTSPMIRQILAFPHSSVDLEKIMNEGKILILNLAQGKLGEDNAALLGAMFITKMQLAAMNRVNIPESERRDFYLYVDEFQNFATTSFVKILSEARKYRLDITVANQYIGQVPEEIQKAIFGNVGTLLAFLVGASDARLLSFEFGEIYEEKDLVSLGNYQVVIKLAIDNLTSTPFPAFTLPLPLCRNKNREKVIRLSRERYTKPTNK